MDYQPRDSTIGAYDQEEDEDYFLFADERPGVRHERVSALRYYLRLPELQSRLGISRSTIYFFIATKRLPPPIKLGARVSLWDATEVSLYIARAQAAPIASRLSRKGVRKGVRKGI